MCPPGCISCQMYLLSILRLFPVPPPLRFALPACIRTHPSLSSVAFHDSSYLFFSSFFSCVFSSKSQKNKCPLPHLDQEGSRACTPLCYQVAFPTAPHFLHRGQGGGPPTRPYQCWLLLSLRVWPGYQGPRRVSPKKGPDKNQN